MFMTGKDNIDMVSPFLTSDLAPLGPFNRILPYLGLLEDPL